MSGLGRRVPTDWDHYDKFPLLALPPVEQPVAVPVVIGINWYDAFDKPEKDRSGAWWIGRGELGEIRGGHCVCLEPGRGAKDGEPWWPFYDQGQEGACVGFGCSRLMSILNRNRYDARWLWNEAKKIDEWDDTNPGDDNGTSVRAGLDVLRTQGHVRVYRGLDRPLLPSEGISANRWATRTEEVLTALGSTKDYVVLLNSWGKSYPHRVRMPAEVLQRLIDEEGEVGIVTDR